MKSLDFLIAVEINNRETLPMLLLKKELERRGYSVELDYVHRIKGGLKKRKARVVIVNYIRSLDHVISAVGKTEFGKIINLKWEQIPLVSESRAIFPISDNKTFERCATNLWGDSCISMDGFFDNISRDYIFECGCPALDFCREKMMQIFERKDTIAKKYGMNANVKWNLFVSSFGYKNYSESQVKKMDLDNGTPFYSYMREVEVATSREILEWFEKIMRENKDEVIVYRPHPTERLEDRLFEMEREYSNFFVIREHDVKQWMIVCDRLFFWWSTSIAEGFYMQKPSYVLRPVDIKKEYEIVTYSNNNAFIRNYEQLRESLKCKWNSTDYPTDQETMNKYYFMRDKYVYEMIADMCEEVYDNEKYSLSQIARDVIKKYQKEQYSNMCIRDKVILYMFASPLYPAYEKLIGRKNAKKEMSKKEMSRIERRIAGVIG